MKTKTPGTNGRLVARILLFITIFAIMASLAMIREGKFFGQKLTTLPSPEVITETADGYVIDTSEPGKDITGYGGSVPLKIYVTHNRIDSVSALPNSETPGFFKRVKESGMLSSWDGLSLQEAAKLNVDAVSGATFSSAAVIGNVRAGVAYALNDSSLAAHSSEGNGLKWILAAVVALMAAILPFFIRNKAYRAVQQILNVAVLGFWTGTFLDYAVMIRFFSSAFICSVASLTTVLLLVTALVYPIFGKPGFYCANICPYGSIQELAMKIPARRVRMTPRTVKVLDSFRMLLWTVLMAFLFTGWCASWIDYEVFTAFVVESASWIVTVVGVVFAILSMFIPRAFCRFVCPTGTILKTIS